MEKRMILRKLILHLCHHDFTDTRHKLIFAILLGTCIACPRAVIAKSGDKPSFDNPVKLCHAIPDLPPTYPWKGAYGDWSCDSSEIRFGAPGPTMLKSTISFEVDGNSSKGAYKLKLVLDLYNPASKTEGLILLRKYTRDLFDNTAFQLPKGVLNSVRKGTPVKVGRHNSEITFEKKLTKITSYVLEITSREYLKSQSKQITNSTPIVNKCRNQITNDLGFSVNELSTDGLPIKEKGYKSFMFDYKGTNNKATIFCEVWPNDHYKLRGSINGDIPFRTLSSGVFPHSSK